MAAKNNSRQPAPKCDERIWAQVTYLYEQGEKIEAIKSCRKASGVGLKETKDFLDTHCQAKRLNPFTQSLVKWFQHEKELLALWRSGQKSEAVKFCVVEFGMDEKEAVQSLEKLSRDKK